MGFAFSRRSLSTRYWNPSTSKTLSLSFGSSRAIPRDGPPHPPSFRKILMGVASFPLKYSLICSLADGVTSTMIPSLRFGTNLWNLFFDSVKVVTPSCFVNNEKSPPAILNGIIFCQTEPNTVQDADSWHMNRIDEEFYDKRKLDKIYGCKTVYPG
jgi:hypothetical protein